ncbi:hypothetical protein NEOC84_000064|nr:hypothetical protein [Neochlamydia sp. AcF84]
MYVGMHIVRSKFKSAAGKVYETVLLRESYREGKTVKKRTVGNLSNCTAEEITAIELALKYKSNLQALASCREATMQEGLSIGGVWVIYQMAKRLGIVDALGNNREGQLALWQVLARVLEQGSRLSAVRLAETYAIAPVIDLQEGFNEEDLYKNLLWLCQNQASIEDRLFTKSFHKKAPHLFLYDVTSSYLEGEKNELAAWGYNRDKKKGKKQIVIGLLSSAEGAPVSAEVFKGHTQDTSTFHAQIKKAKERFNCEKVTFVGDRGMIKSGQIEDLQAHGFHYITALTKAQVETLMKKGVIEYTLFDENLVEVKENGIRYILRRNPVRAQEIAHSRLSKLASIEKLVAMQNAYLQAHPKAHMEVALKKIKAKIERLALKSCLTVSAQDRSLSLCLNQEMLAEDAKLDGCYVIKTDLAHEEVSMQEIHDRYKDLARVESAFRTVKSDLEIRPVYVRSEESTRGHVLIVMLAYMIIRELDKSWRNLYLTVEEGLRSLSTLTLIEWTLNEGLSFQQIPEPRHQNKQMLEALKIELPKVLPKNHAHVVTRKKRRQKP